MLKGSPLDPNEQGTSKTSEKSAGSIPTEVDVLCGRTKLCFKHKGNHEFRVLIADNADSYQMATSKKAKMKVVYRTVDIILARGGRFLVENPADGSWVDGGRKQGQKKTGHAFRDALRGRVKCITRMRENNGSRTFTEKTTEDVSDASEEEFELDDNDFLGLLQHDNSADEPTKDWKNDTVANDLTDDIAKLFR